MGGTETTEVTVELAGSSPASANWQVDLASRHREYGRPMRHARLMVATLLAILTAPSNSISDDPWVQGRRTETSTVLRQMLSPRRRVSPAEARQIAMRILAESEAKRMRFVEAEAGPMAIWEEQGA